MSSATEFYKEIAADFPRYDSFMKADKLLKFNTCRITYGHETKSRLDCSASNGESHVYFWASWENPKKYKLQLSADDFGKAPCFRLDVWGHYHMNPDDGTGLLNRKVPIPHFHRVGEDGVLKAYQTPELAAPGAREAIQDDIQLGTSLFCQETRVVSLNGGVVTVQLHAEVAFLSTDDPLGDIQFPP